MTVSKKEKKKSKELTKKIKENKAQYNSDK